ncbi:MAG: hypothetical protein DWH81_14720 [Planctomycetota bacterium]|nr:MAG: hypothetical protein DWH81_14720 [Planctomycetota bacterium]
MFRHVETLSLFGLTAVQTVVLGNVFQNCMQFGTITSLFAGLIPAFIASCIEIYIIVRYFIR